MVLLVVAFVTVTIAGKYYTVKYMISPAMQDVIPQGSAMLVKYVDAGELKVGDDITYSPGKGRIITHRIIDIFENYDDTGMIGFQMKGTKNPAPDVNVVLETDVIGRVDFHIPKVGSFLSGVPASEDNDAEDVPYAEVTAQSRQD